MRTLVTNCDKIAKILYAWLFRSKASVVFWCLVVGVVGVAVGPSITTWLMYPRWVEVVSTSETCSVTDSSTLWLDRETGKALSCGKSPFGPEIALDFPYPDAEKEMIRAQAREYAEYGSGGISEYEEGLLYDTETEIQYRNGRSDTIPTLTRLLAVLPLLLSGLAIPAVVRELFAGWHEAGQMPRSPHGWGL